ncbi:MAG: hypothetical protein MASP_00670 [Candidatus Methanolliviera sp. GoM_asphalt]|nr:MAG: hypothetical protein MASP_00670 [Candidatus Methanolliviera sp. GoM_asphalt]
MRRKRAFTEKLLDSIPISTIITTVDGDMVSANKRYKSYLDRSGEAFEGQRGGAIRSAASKQDWEKNYRIGKRGATQRFLW